MYHYIENPLEIEKKSFEIIHSEMKNTNLDPLRLSIMKRVIHTTTDFDYEEILWFKESIENQLVQALQAGCTLITDTEMIRAGISKPLAKKLNVDIQCYVGSEEAYKVSKDKNITRSMASVDIAMDLPEQKIFVIGNAPTALYRILEHKDNMNTVIGVIGVPVGFVGAKESKEVLWDSSIPSMITMGRKGGSTVAVAIVNALLREAVKGIE
jgi:precorrin-8X/cobalt-precorrin-8 methylmutase